MLEQQRGHIRDKDMKIKYVLIDIFQLGSLKRIRPSKLKLLINNILVLNIHNSIIRMTNMNLFQVAKLEMLQQFQQLKKLQQMLRLSKNLMPPRLHKFHKNFKSLRIQMKQKKKMSKK